MLRCVADKEIEVSQRAVQQFLRTGTPRVFQQDQDLCLTKFFIAGVHGFDQSVRKNY